MTPEERFERIEATLEGIGASHKASTVRMDRLEVEFEKTKHENDLRYQQLLQMQAHLMESQNRTWDLIQALGAKIDKQTENIDRLIQRRGPNGHQL